MKLKDSYKIDEMPLVKEKLEKDTESYTNHLIAKIGYSTLPAFKQKKLPVPAMASIEYRKQFLSKNSVAKDLLTFDMSVFF